VVALFAGCISARLGDLTLVSNQNVDTAASPGRAVEGKDCIIDWFGAGVMPSLEEAVDDAQRQGGGGGNALSNVAIYFDQNVFGKKCYRVKGQAIHMNGGR